MCSCSTWLSPGHGLLLTGHLLQGLCLAVVAMALRSPLAFLGRALPGFPSHGPLLTGCFLLGLYLAIFWPLPAAHCPSPVRALPGCGGHGPPLAVRFFPGRYLADVAMVHRLPFISCWGSTLPSWPWPAAYCSFSAGALPGRCGHGPLLSAYFRVVALCFVSCCCSAWPSVYRLLSVVQLLSTFRLAG